MMAKILMAITDILEKLETRTELNSKKQYDLKFM